MTQHLTEAREQIARLEAAASEARTTAQVAEARAAEHLQRVTKLQAALKTATDAAAQSARDQARLEGEAWLQTATSLQRTSPFTGKFVAVRALPPTDEGRGNTAISVVYASRRGRLSSREQPDVCQPVVGSYGGKNYECIQSHTC